MWMPQILLPLPATTWLPTYRIHLTCPYFMPGPDIWTTLSTRPRCASRMPSPPSSPFPIMSWGCRWPGTLSGRGGATSSSSKTLPLWGVCIFAEVVYELESATIIEKWSSKCLCWDMRGFFLCWRTLQNTTVCGDSYFVSHTRFLTPGKKHFFCGKPQLTKDFSVRS